MRCIHCGAPIDENDIICTTCGKEQQPIEEQNNVEGVPNNAESAEKKETTINVNITIHNNSKPKLDDNSGCGCFSFCVITLTVTILLHALVGYYYDSIPIPKVTPAEQTAFKEATEGKTEYLREAELYLKWGEFRYDGKVLPHRSTLLSITAYRKAQCNKNAFFIQTKVLLLTPIIALICWIFYQPKSQQKSSDEK
jgi:hypothetical protein